MKPSEQNQHTAGCPSRWLASLAIVAALGCGDGLLDEVEGRTNSNIGELTYVCVDWGDPACTYLRFDDADVPRHRDRDDEFPPAVALGARIGISTNVAGSIEGTYSAAPHILEPIGEYDIGGPTAFLAVSEGRVGVYALRTDRTLVRYEHVDIVAPAAMELDGPHDTTFVVGQVDFVDAVLVDSDGRHLAGALPWIWSTDAPDTLALAIGEEGIVGSGQDDVARIEALAPGRATVRVEAGGVVSEFTVTVQ